ncbi:MAG: hypothetical protein HY244_10615 [Rhizobiales bacterium]|nr:hypothetical protein [Hyphomicrobiales bacterium]
MAHSERVVLYHAQRDFERERQPNERWDYAEFVARGEPVSGTTAISDERREAYITCARAYLEKRGSYKKRTEPERVNELE